MWHLAWPMMTFHRPDFRVSGYLPVRVDGVEVLKVVPDASGDVSEKEELFGIRWLGALILVAEVVGLV